MREGLVYVELDSLYYSARLHEVRFLDLSKIIPSFAFTTLRGFVGM